MQFESFEREEPRINVSALIDVVFILLIFVVLAANFDQIREMNVLLPSAEQTNELTPEALQLSLSQDGVISIEGVEISDEELEDTLRTHRQEYEVLVLVGDGRVQLDRAVRIFDKASAVGFESVSIATQGER